VDLLSEIGYQIDPSTIMEKYGYSPDEWQQRILIERPERLLLNCSRQSGKTTVVATMAVDEMLRGPNLVLAICPSERQSKELLRTVSQIYRSVEALPEQESTICIQCPNGARMFALPSSEANIRGFSKVALLLIDEASRVKDELFHSVKPMLAISHGRLACLSTPFGKRGFFHEEWTKGVGWDRVMVKATDCPRISAKFIAEEKAALPEAWFRQEYMCEFADTDGAVFNYDDVMRALRSDVLPLFDLPAEGLSAEVEPLFQ